MTVSLALRCCRWWRWAWGLQRYSALTWAFHRGNLRLAETVSAFVDPQLEGVMQMRTRTPRPPVTISLIALNTTGRVERLVHVGRVNSPANARDMLALTRRAMKEHKTKIAF